MEKNRSLHLEGKAGHSLLSTYISEGPKEGEDEGEQEGCGCS